MTPIYDPQDKYDGISAFLDNGAAEYMSTWSPVPLTPTQCAELLSRLASSGLIVSVAFHEMLCDQYADSIEQANGAADDLVRRLEGANRAQGVED